MGAGRGRAAGGAEPWARGGRSPSKGEEKGGWSKAVSPQRSLRSRRRGDSVVRGVVG